MPAMFRNVGPSLQRALWWLAGIHFVANVLRHAARHLVVKDLMTLAIVLALGGMCVGAFLGLLARKRHAFAAALIAHGFIALDARYLHQTLVSVGEIIGRMPDIAKIDIVVIPILLTAWCVLLAMQVGLISLITRGFSQGWKTPLWEATKSVSAPSNLVVLSGRQNAGGRSA